MILAARAVEVYRIRQKRGRMGTEEQRIVWEKLHNSSLEEQARAEQEVFYGLNSTDTILNLVRESMRFLREAGDGHEKDEICMDLLQIASALQAVQREAERANEILHLLEEHLVEYADVNEQLYQKFVKGELE